jgi:hypothetical protein
MLATGGLSMLGMILMLALATDEPPAWPPNRVPLQPRAKDDAELIAEWRKAGFDETMFGPVPDAPAALVPAIRPQRWRALAGAMSESQAMIVHLTGAKDREWIESMASAEGGLEGEFGLAVAELESEHDEVRFARLAGASLLLVNDEPFQGDPELRGYEGVPVALRKGANAILVAGIEGGFELEFWKPQTRLVIATWDIWCPRWTDGDFEVADRDVEVVLFHASNERSPASHFHYGPLTSKERLPKLTDWQCGHEFAPLAMHAGLGLTDRAGEWSFSRLRSADCVLPLSAWCDDDADADRRTVPVRSRGTDARARPRTSIGWLELARTLESKNDLWDAPDRHLVYGTRGDPTTKVATLSLARFWQQRCWYQADLVPTVYSDEEYLRIVDASRNDRERTAILFGDAATNGAIARLAPGLSLDQVRASLAIVPDVGAFVGAARSQYGVVHFADAASMDLALAIDPFSDESIAGTAITLRARANGIERILQAPAAK